MGLVRFGPPTELIFQLRSAFSIDSFIETGTYRGDTAFWAAGQFAHVVTLEGSEKVFAYASARLKDLPNVRVLHANSSEALPKIIPMLPKPAIFWLDAHWCGGPTFGQEIDNECVLLSELRAIHASPHQHFILIDDARLFLAPPPRPHKPAQWPTIEQVIAAIRQGPREYYIAIFEDVIIAVPMAAKEIIVQHCQTRGR